jgi:hypothetical protein
VNADDKPAVTLETPRDPDGHLIEVGQIRSRQLSR